MEVDRCERDLREVVRDTGGRDDVVKGERDLREVVRETEVGDDVVRSDRDFLKVVREGWREGRIVADFVFAEAEDIREGVRPLVVVALKGGVGLLEVAALEGDVGLLEVAALKADLGHLEVAVLEGDVGVRVVTSELDFSPNEGAEIDTLDDQEGPGWLSAVVWDGCPIDSGMFSI